MKSRRTLLRRGAERPREKAASSIKAEPRKQDRRPAKPLDQPFKSRHNYKHKGTVRRCSNPAPDASTIGIRFSQLNSEVKTVSTVVELTVPPQTVNVPPQSRMDDFYQIYRTVEEKDYLVDFMIGDRSKFIGAIDANHHTLYKVV